MPNEKETEAVFAFVRAVAAMDNCSLPWPVMKYTACGHRAPFYLMRPANCYPGNVGCPECGSDKTEAEQ